MQFQLCTVFFTFSLGTRTHYFGRTILHGGARVLFLSSVLYSLNTFSGMWQDSVFQQYQATGRGFVVKHITFSENYRLYSRSHFVKGYLYYPLHTFLYVYLFSHSKRWFIHLVCFSFFYRLEVILLLVVYLAYGNDKAGAVSYILLTVSSWFLAGSWLFAPFLFNPAGFEWQK